MITNKFDSNIELKRNQCLIKDNEVFRKYNKYSTT